MRRGGISVVQFRTLCFLDEEAQRAGELAEVAIVGHLLDLAPEGAVRRLVRELAGMKVALDGVLVGLHHDVVASGRADAHA